MRAGLLVVAVILLIGLGRRLERQKTKSLI